MRRIAFIFVLMFLSAIVFSGCKGRTGQSVTIIGMPYEVLVVAGDALWNSQAGNSLKAVLAEPVPMINSYEPMFDVIRVAPEGFKGVTIRHRNIILLETDHTLIAPEVRVFNDMYAHPQLIMSIRADNVETLSAYISANDKHIREIVRQSERKRTVSMLRTHNDKTLRSLIQEMFGFDMLIAESFTERSRIDDRFLWLSEERPLTSRGIVIYTEPAHINDLQNMTTTELTALRNRSVKNIPGPSENTHMTTSTHILSQTESFDKNGLQVVRMSGFWDVEGDFMGGPFVNYTLHDTIRNRIVNIDMYVYAPSGTKRNLIFSLEDLVSGSGIFGGE